jgi:hypothetical protein
MAKLSRSFSLSNIFTIKRHISLHSRAMSNERSKCIASQWISFCFLKELCISIAIYATHLFARKTLHLEEEAVRTIRLEGILQFVCLPLNHYTCSSSSVGPISRVRCTLTTIPTRRPVLSVSQDIHLHRVHRSIGIRDSYPESSTQGSVGERDHVRKGRETILGKL